ncbi:MAG: peptidase M52 [Herpetosiphonaceae bacterium]|nr:MAG: peptidase M52 [Herpetosiphonaceae bacterium]
MSGVQPAVGARRARSAVPVARLRLRGSPRILVAGVGNVLRGDDGFGPAVIRALEDSGRLPRSVRTIEVGIGGIGLVQELMDGYDALVLVDAVDRGGSPGSLYLLEPQVPDPLSISPHERRELVADIHQAVPGLALMIARAVGALPAVARIVGCQPAVTDELSVELSPPVQQAVPQAVEMILALLADLLQGRPDQRRRARSR